MTSQVPKKVIVAFILVVACISAYFFFRPYNPPEANGAQDTLKLWTGQVYGDGNERWQYAGKESHMTVAIYFNVWRSFKSGVGRVCVWVGEKVSIKGVLYTLVQIDQSYVVLRRAD